MHASPATCLQSITFFLLKLLEKYMVLNFFNVQIVGDIVEEVQKCWFSSKGISSMSSQDIVIDG